MSSVNKCPICLFTIKDLASPNTCLHEFCFKCLLNWSEIENTCPSCRIRFSQIHRNVNVRLRRRRFKDRSSKSTKVDVQDRFQRVETNFSHSSRACLDCGSSREPHLMLNCDGCNAWYHSYCLDLPQGDRGTFWFCHNCQSNSHPDFDPSRPSSSMSNKSSKDKGCSDFYGAGGGCRSDGEDSLHSLGVATRSRTKYHRKLLTTGYTTPNIGADPVESSPYPTPSPTSSTTAGKRRGRHRRRRNTTSQGKRAGRERSDYDLRVNNISKKEAMYSTPSSHPHHRNTRSLTKRQRTGRGGNGQCGAAEGGGRASPVGSSRHRSNNAGGSGGKRERTQLTVHFADQEESLPVSYTQAGGGTYNLRRESASVSPQHQNHILPQSYHRTSGRHRKQSQKAESTGKNQREEARGHSPQPPYLTRAAAAAELRSLSPYLQAPSKGSSSSSSSLTPNAAWHFDLPKNAHGHSRLTAKLKALDAEVRMSQACEDDEKNGQKQGPGGKTPTSFEASQDHRSSSCPPQSNQASSSRQVASGSSSPSSPSNRIATRSSSSLISTRSWSLLALP